MRGKDHLADKTATSTNPHLDNSLTTKTDPDTGKNQQQSKDLQLHLRPPLLDPPLKHSQLITTSHLNHLSK